MNTIKSSNKLYWKISATLLLLLVVLGLCYIVITSFTSRHYFQEVNQRLYGNIAQHLVEETQPLVNGQVDTTATHDIMHSMMVINPSAEVYLLDPSGKIIDYVVPYSKVKLERVDLTPVKKFIASEGQDYILGDDPKAPSVRKVFSAAPILENDELAGYAYIILASEEQAEVASMLFGSYMLQLGGNLFFVSLAGASLIGLIALWFLTKNLRIIIDTVRRFKEGDYEARIPESAKGDLSILADTYNEMADRIVENIEQLKSVDRLRQELIANVSHDLRTPLAIMQGYVETLIMKKEDLSEEERSKYLNVVLDSSEKLSHLIQQLFEYSKLEANQIQPEKEPFFMNELAQDVLASYHILAEQKNIELQLNAPEQLPLVFADISLVERVIQNLMDNALKFTPEGGTITIDLGTMEEGVEVKIVDSGQGIPEEEQAHIFERYRQSSTKSKSSKGAGLGLAIVKKILDIHNATIRVHSRPNQGATFFFALPAYQNI